MTEPFDRADWWDPDGFLIGLRELLNPVRIPYIERRLNDVGARTVLDVGCGGGYVSSALAMADFDVTGVDGSSSAIAAAAANTSVADFVVGDAHVLPFEPESFDAAVLSEILEHVGRPEVVFREAARVVGEGGLIVVTGPNRTFLSRLVLIWLAQEWPTGVLPSGLHDHAAFVTSDELARWATDIGVEPVDVTGLSIRASDTPRAITAMARLRRGSLTYAEAGRAVELCESRNTSGAYLASFRKR